MRLSGTHCCLFLIKSLRCKTSLRPHVQVLVTTSRDPSSSLTAFAKEIALLLPGAKTQNRGATILSQLVDSCRSSSVTDIVILHEHRCGACLVSALCLPCVCLAPALFFFAVRRQPCAYLAAPASRVLTLRRQPLECLPCGASLVLALRRHPCAHAFQRCIPRCLPAAAPVQLRLQCS